jgi:hypothetical protein
MEMRVNYLTKIWRAVQRIFNSSKEKDSQQKGIAFAD